MKQTRMTAMIAFSLLPLMVGCGQTNFTTGDDRVGSASLSSQSAQSQLGQVSMTVRDMGGAVIYSDANPATSLKLKAGTTYQVDIAAPSAPTGTTFQLLTKQINVLSGAQNTQNLQKGSNNLTVPAAGDYSWKLTAAAPSMLPTSKFYQADVSCASPTFTASSLNANGISVSAAGASNLYNFNVSGVVSGANGQAPYLCALDPTGTGIVDTAFVSCSQVFQNVYVNYVNYRNVGVIVKDACNTTHSISKNSLLAFQVPNMPGNVFIYGQTSNGTGLATSDVRANNVTYLATNSGGHNIVQPFYQKGAFTITSFMNYGMPSSVDFGMRIKLKGLTDTINIKTGTGSISAASAMIDTVEYKTDQAGDQAPAVSFKGSQCSLTNQNAKVLFVSGTPCAAGTTGSNNKATVEVWGRYSCTGLASDGGTISVSGEFDGYYDIVDNCSGGGGGGGGVVPINL